jgi:polyisoprenyl-teichoic acid--peptidoglycan teichoic acid transferase
MVKRKKLLWGIGIILLILLITLALKTLPFLWGVFVDKNINIKKTREGDINVLLMGIGGGIHEGPDLTDTIILASVHPGKNRVDLISIPRDLYIKSLGKKINHAYSMGQNGGDKGILVARSTVNFVTGVRPDYVFVIDFSGFVKLVDLLGGVDVNVENTLDDYAYPVEGKEQELCGATEDGIASFSAQIATGSATEFDFFPCRFDYFHVEEGFNRMDGELALKFVRSRHALGAEGTDFARSRRQQLVIDAIRNKVLSLGTLANPVKIVGIINIIKGNIFTDIPEDQYDDFIKLAQKMKGAKITNYVIDQGDFYKGTYGLLENPPLIDYYGQWVLIPRVGVSNFSEIKEYVACILSGKECMVSKTGIETIPTPTIAP